jgi:hypothetical protein
MQIKFQEASQFTPRKIVIQLFFHTTREIMLGVMSNGVIPVSMRRPGMNHLQMECH